MTSVHASVSVLNTCSTPSTVIYLPFRYFQGPVSVKKEKIHENFNVSLHSDISLMGLLVPYSLADTVVCNLLP